MDCQKGLSKNLKKFYQMILNREFWLQQKGILCAGKEEAFWPAYLHSKICGSQGHNTTNKRIKLSPKKLFDYQYFFIGLSHILKKNDLFVLILKMKIMTTK